VRRWVGPGIATALAAGAALSAVPALGIAARAAFVLLGAAPIGAVLLRAIGRLVGGAWAGAVPSSLPFWWVVVAAVVMLTPTGTPLPAHLSIWSSAPFVAVRAALALAGLAWAAGRLRAGAGQSFAGLTLTVYALLATPLGADWLLPTAPGHPVSAIGMMLFCLQIAAGCALALTRAEGRDRRDLALLLIAALLGLCYLSFVDYLILWFGNLPQRVPFYLARSGGLAAAGFAVGLGGAIAGASSGRPVWSILAGALCLFLFVIWWLSADLVTAGVALAVVLAAVAVHHGKRAPG
jgi:hypothetical protein